MADKNSKAANSVSGKYYVDTNCINCGQCIDIAGNFFVENQKYGHFLQKKFKKDYCENSILVAYPYRTEPHHTVPHHTVQHRTRAYLSVFMFLNLRFKTVSFMETFNFKYLFFDF